MVIENKRIKQKFIKKRYRRNTRKKNLKSSNMDTDKYFQIMEETGNYTYFNIDKYISKEAKEDDLKKFIRNFIGGRLQNKRRLRSTFVRAVYHILTNNNEEWKKGKNLYSFAELWCIADYLSNDAFDNKLDKCKAKIPDDPNLFFMASATTRELAQEALQNAFNDFSTPLEARVEALENFSNLVKKAYSHQWVDYTLKYDWQSIKWLEENLEKLFKKRYLDYQAGNVFGDLLEISSLVINPKKENERKLLKEYGKNMGANLQLVNDIADIAENCYDTKNKILTYPLVLTMIKTGKDVYRLPPSEVRDLFVKSGAFKDTKKKIICLKKPLNDLEKVIGENKGISLLRSFVVISKQNKYYKILRNYKNGR